MVDYTPQTSPLIQSPGGVERETTPPRTSPLLGTMTVPSLPRPEQKEGSMVPHGMDSASFMAGERSAYANAFAAALPSQHALGQLFTAVETLHSRLEEDSAAVRDLRIGMAHATSSLDSVAQRVTAVEHTTIPAIQRRCDDILARPALPPEIADALGHLNCVLGGLAQAQTQYLEAAAGYPGSAGYVLNQLKWLINTGLGYAGAALSRADVAAVFLSRKVLVGDVAAWQGGRRRRVRAAAGAALFVGCVEAAWHLHGSAARRLPRPLQRFGAPLRTGLKIARGAVWTAAFVLAAWEVRRACESVISSAETEAEAPRSPASARQPPRRPASAGSPPPPQELMRDNMLYDAAMQKNRGASDSKV